MDKPDKYKWSEFIRNPIIRFWEKLVIIIKVYLLRFWWCDHCNTYHNPRIRKYKRYRMIFVEVNICSLGLDKS